MAKPTWFGVNKVVTDMFTAPVATFACVALHGQSAPTQQYTHSTRSPCDVIHTRRTSKNMGNPFALRPCSTQETA